MPETKDTVSNSLINDEESLLVNLNYCKTVKTANLLTAIDYIKQYLFDKQAI